MDPAPSESSQPDESEAGCSHIFGLFKEHHCTLLALMEIRALSPGQLNGLEGSGTGQVRKAPVRPVTHHRQNDLRNHGVTCSSDKSVNSARPAMQVFQIHTRTQEGRVERLIDPSCTLPSSRVDDIILATTQEQAVPLNIRNEAVNQLAKKLAVRKHLNKTEAVKVALENELRRIEEALPLRER